MGRRPSRGGRILLAALLACLLQLGCCSLKVDAALRDDIYVSLPMETASGICFRLLNASGQFGCQSDRAGNEGVLVHVRDKADLIGAEEGWPSRFPGYARAEFIVAIEENVVTGDALSVLARAVPVRGVVILKSRGGVKGRSDDERLSDEAACPNQASSLYSDWRACSYTEPKERFRSSQWNSKGAMLESGTRFLDWNKPLMRLNNATTIETILKCHNEYNVAATAADANAEGAGAGRLCAVSFKIFSNAAGDSDMCLRRQKPGLIETDQGIHLCDGLTEKNVFAVIPPVPVNGDEKERHEAEYLGMIARMDSVSIIPEATPGAISALSSVIAMLSAAKVVGDNLEAFERASNASNRRVVFAFLHGESFDYMGSSRWVYDMANGAFPVRPPSSDAAKGRERTESITLKQFASIIELQQLADEKELWTHTDGKSYVGGARGKIDSLVSLLATSLAPLGYALHSTGLGDRSVLPPSSLHSVLKARRETPTLLIAPFDKQYTNRRLSSQWDTGADGEKMKQTIAAVASALAQAAATHVGIADVKKKTLEVDREWIATLHTCFIASADWRTCDYFKAILSQERFADRLYLLKSVPTTYVGADGHSLMRALVYSLLVRATGTHRETTNIKTREMCEQVNEKQSLHHYIWAVDPPSNTSFCWRTDVRTASADSPAFLPGQESSKYPRWTESYYSIDENLRLFLVERHGLDWTTMLVGALIAVLSTMIACRVDDDSFIVDEGEVAAEAGEPL